jgi:hypothetical protein
MNKFILLATLLLLVAGAAGQAGRPGQGRRFTGPEPEIPPTSSEFTFVRTVYNSGMRGFGRRGGTWATDFPNADYHFIAGIRFWSGAILDISPKPAQIRILDERIFDYPLIYFVEPGFLELSDEEALRLREYVLRGGFLFLDDFWGDYEWENVRTQLKKIFPAWTPEDLPLDHPLFHCYFDIDQVIQIPGIGAWLSGSTSEKGGIVPHYMGVQNDKGRVVTFITRNCDLGDAWEWINDQRYPLKYGLAAYRLGINVITYAMTH